MANVILNRALGRIRQYADNVDTNNPAASVFRVFALVMTGDQHEAVRDLSTMTMTGLFGLANVAEATNAGYVNQTIDDTAMTITVDDTLNKVTIAGGDVTFTAVAAGDVWTHLCYAYDSSGADDDGVTIPLAIFDFAATPAGGDITADEPASGFYETSQ